MYDVSAAARADRPFEVWAPWSTAYTTWTHPSPTEQTDVLWAARSGEARWWAWPACRCRCSTTSTRRTPRSSSIPTTSRRGIGVGAARRLMAERARASGTHGADGRARTPPSIAPGHRRGVLGLPGLRARHRRDAAGVRPGGVASPRGGRWQNEAADAPRRLPARALAGPRYPSRWSRATAEMGEAFNDEAPLGESGARAEAWSPERVAQP